jgi:uncharacterized protein YcaQ
VAALDRAADQRLLDELSELDRAWLEEQLERYRDLLEYLRDH